MFAKFFIFVFTFCSLFVQKSNANSSDVNNNNVSNDICGNVAADDDDKGAWPMPGLKKKLKLMRLDCGQVCDTDIKPTRKSKYYDFIEKNVDCLTLFESPGTNTIKTFLPSLNVPLIWTKLLCRIWGCW